jgi:hypothetical protein
MVYLKLQPFAQTSVAHRSCAKLTFKYFGPFKIVDKTGSTAYKLLLPESAVIHPVFHVSQLKQHIPNFAPVFTELPPAAFSEVVPPNPESIGSSSCEKGSFGSHSGVDQMDRASYRNVFLGRL